MANYQLEFSVFIFYGRLSRQENSSGLGMTKEQGEADSLVVVVDDDASVRQALTSLLQSVGLRVEAFGSAADFLKRGV